MSIDFTTLQERLRSALWKQIQAGELTGVQLARETGFQQAHISNFLNRHRGLSLQAMDLVMKKRGFNLFDLVKNDELAPRLAMREKAEDGYENVILVDGADCRRLAARRAGERARCPQVQSIFLAETACRWRYWPR